MRLWRLLKTRYAADAFSGEGARLHGGRWNSPGTRVAYASSDAALAVLEVLVHLEDTSALPSFSLVMASLPDALIETPDESMLPARWRDSPTAPAAQAFGDAWVRSGRSVGLRVPSVLVRGGSNVLLNPAHPKFGQFVVESVEPFELDPRLH